MWVFFSWNLETAMAIFEISTLEYFNMGSFMPKKEKEKKKRNLHSGQKMLYSSSFGLEKLESLMQK